MTLLLAFDGGGTATRCIAVDPDGIVRGEGRAGPSNHLHVPVESARDALRSAAGDALAAAGATAADVLLVSAGLAGVDADGTGAEEATRMLRAGGFARVLVHGDMVTAHRGALAGGPGVCAVAGTGSSVLGIAADGTTIKAGGWGPLYGDQGSAYQIGRLGLVAAAEAFDGSGAPTMLVTRLTAALGVATFPATVGRLYPGQSAQLQVAALAKVVNACAEAGDEVAGAICRRAGRELARTVLAVVRRLEPPVQTISYQGAVLIDSKLVHAAFLDEVHVSRPDLDVRPPRFEPVVGAAILGAAAAGWRPPAEIGEIARGL